MEEEPTTAAEAANPSGGSGGPEEASEAASGPGPSAQGPSGGDDQGTVEETVELTAPQFPAEMHIASATYFLQKLPGGGMMVKFIATVPTPAGQAPVPPAYSFAFTAESWEAFQRNVAEGKVQRAPDIAVPRRMPERPGFPRVHLPGQ